MDSIKGSPLMKSEVFQMNNQTLNKHGKLVAYTLADLFLQAQTHKKLQVVNSVVSSMVLPFPKQIYHVQLCR